MSTETSFIPGLSDPRLTRFYDPVLKWIFWEDFFRAPLIKAIDAQPGQTVVDVGCGTGTLTFSLQRAYPAAIVIGVDIDPMMLRLAQIKMEDEENRTALVQASAVSLPGATQSVDHVVASMMVHHLTTAQKEALFVEAHRILKPGACFHILDFYAPQSAWLTSLLRPLAHFEHLDDNLNKRLPTMLSDAGFAHVEVVWRTLNGLLTVFAARA